MLFIKQIHIILALTSALLFTLRGFWLLRGHSLPNTKVVRVLPHIIDTGLLGSAMLLSVSLRLFPLTTHWLTAKILALLIYIGLGLFALRLGKTRRVRMTCFVLALLTLFYIFGVANTHTPLSWYGYIR